VAVVLHALRLAVEVGVDHRMRRIPNHAHRVEALLHPLDLFLGELAQHVDAAVRIAQVLLAPVDPCELGAGSPK